MPLGASAFWLWWVSTISMSKSGRSTPLISSSTRRNTATPTEKLALWSTGAYRPRSVNAAIPSARMPVVPERRGVPVRRI